MPLTRATPQFTSILIPYLTHAVGAILILIAGTVLARFLSRSVLIGAVNLQLQYARFLSLGVKWLVLVLTAAMVLDHLEIGGAIVALAFGILFGGIVLTLALAIGLARATWSAARWRRTSNRLQSAAAFNDMPSAVSSLPRPSPLLSWGAPV